MIVGIIEIIGWLATILVLAAFYLNTRKIILTNSKLFLTMNAISGLCMSINAAYHHAYPSMAANMVWLLIAVTGLIKNKKYRPS